MTVPDSRANFPENGFCPRCGHQNQIVDIEGVARPRCLACGHITYLDPKLAVGVIIERDGAILLGRRAEGAREAGRWSFPAGFVERGERIELAAVREVREETGLTVRIDRLIGVFSEPGETVVLIVYAGAVESGTERAEDDLDLLAWYPFDSLPELAFPRDRHILADWLEQRGFQV